uniref:DUF6265 domain-containing protein n=1 Tax=Phenylobacterium glaciei TaxID=2803784 RepID=A0A974P803_9CAUL|nr:hypothetical protein JKL49_05110 [Phenylobacterium glaciei]
MMLAMLAAAVIAAPADLTWMAGSWTHEQDGVVTRETWLPPLAGTMSGAGQTNRPGKPARSEFMTITVTPAGLTFTAHVDGQPPTPSWRSPATRAAPSSRTRPTISPAGHVPPLRREPLRRDRGHGRRQAARRALDL